MKNVVLVGYMGSGKSSVGKQLSKALGYIFLDADEAIEVEYDTTISEIFEHKGEEYFRELETEYIRKLITLGKRDIVLSTGGGMPIREINQELLKKVGYVVYLRAKPETIYNRVKEDTKRPLLKGEDLMNKIVTMLEKRSPIYERIADYCVDVDELTQNEIAEIIKKEVEQNEITSN